MLQVICTLFERLYNKRLCSVWMLIHSTTLRCEETAWTPCGRVAFSPHKASNSASTFHTNVFQTVWTISKLLLSHVAVSAWFMDGTPCACLCLTRLTQPLPGNLKPDLLCNYSGLLVNQQLEVTTAGWKSYLRPRLFVFRFDPVLHYENMILSINNFSPHISEGRMEK